MRWGLQRAAARARSLRPGRRWLVLGLAVAAQIASLSALFGVAFVIPELRQAYGITVARAGTLAGLPSLGLLLTLLGWGVLIDRYGERLTMAVSLGATAGLLAVFPLVDTALGAGLVLFGVGAVAGPVNAASGRLVMGWFAARERGLAMGLRQTAQPLGMGLSAALLPVLAHHYGVGVAMLLPGVLAVAVLPLVVKFAVPPGKAVAAGPAADAPQPQRAGSSPYRHAAIWRVHAVSMLLGVPQFTVATFALVYLVDQQSWTAPAAGALMAAVYVPGAAARLGAGVWSDRVGSRLRPVRIIACCGAVALVLLAAASPLPGIAVVLLVLAAVLTMSHNGLTFTAVGETAGLGWAGRAMAVQNTLQAVSSTLTPVVMGVLIDWAGYRTAFAAAALFSAAAAVLLTPPQSGRRAAVRQ
ncbi:MAG: MFS transporter [Thermobifida fusca]|jgi:MFS family permease|uniref:MFS transporter n=1 Tax=Thermobifida TaxID=83677 RepID=UPI0009DC3F0A|nr:MULTISPECIES: MFS transporter [Thermobifida]MBO2530320.1 MFS transporter [Thermobifida sp.]MDD6792218.1 MFS transporter [Thermobifida fusca]PZN63383.1 MAG: MFS transporter [Thermobifida fusca]QOS58740.1 MFS transporter [Thermobifida fusca]